MKVRYVSKNFNKSSLDVIDAAVAICEEYSGFSLTLRQLYYQFVARALLANNQANYNRLGSIINDARLAGKFDWAFITDRTRNLEKQSTWSSPEQMIESAAKQFLMDLWAPQKRRVEVWIEKDAAIGVIEQVCDYNNVPFLSCRGYMSQSEMYNAATRIGEYLRNGEQTTILHIGDHDPSGLDMTRDIEDRLRLFIHQDWVNEFPIGGTVSRGAIRGSMRDVMRQQGSEIEDDETPWQVKRIALTIDQINQYQPPPNYAKRADSRFEQYQRDTGLDESWELDALDPAVMESLINDEIEALRDEDVYAEAMHEQETNRQVLLAVKDNWETIKRVHAPKEGAR